MRPNPTPLAAMMTLFITVFLGSTEPMMNNDLKPTQAQIREAMQAEYENAARTMLDTERLSFAQRLQFACNCQNRVTEIMDANIERMSATTCRKARAVLLALDDLITGDRYSGVTA